MRRCGMKYLVPVALLALTACDQPTPEAADPPGRTPAAAADLPSPVAAPARTGQPGPAAPQLVAAAEKGEKGARNVLLEWARALERRDFARADAQWGAGADQAASAAQFARFQTMTVALGDGAIEGGAGSLYYEVPVTITGKAAAGDPQKIAGSVTVRRVNDVDGATAEQLRWHLAALNLAG